MKKPQIGLFSLTGCGGDQIMILNFEDDLLNLLSNFEIKTFHMGSSYNEETNLDLAIIEGSVSTKNDLEKLKSIRAKSKNILALGDCAVGGCVQAMRNSQTTIAERMKDVYGTSENLYDALEPKGLSAYVKVDFTIPGCPIEKEEFINTIASIIHGDQTSEIDYPVCVDCKHNGYPCLIIEKNMPCLGPITTGGCDARCPGLNLECIGCRGPIKGETNATEELNMLLDLGYEKESIINRLRFFGGNFEEIINLTKRALNKQLNTEAKKK